MFALPFHMIDPVALQLGPLAIRWYSLAYVGGLVFGAWYAILLLRCPRLWGGTGPPIDPNHAWDVMFWIAVGIILGGRLGFTLVYAPSYYLSHPVEILHLWQGGMSFHGGMVGAGLAIVLCARRGGGSMLSAVDLLACVSPIGLFLGRVANFVNGELWGRPSDLPWAMVFPGAGDEPRHPSQLYEAGLEGILPLLLLGWLAWRTDALRRPGMLGGLFLAIYGTARILVEQVRQPDLDIGFLVPIGDGGLTMGMLLSLPMVLVGACLALRGYRRGPAA